MRYLTLITLAILSHPVVADDPHNQNAIYRDLLMKGVPIAPKFDVPIRQPFMPDGIDRVAQTKVITDFVGETHPLDEFLRKSVVAPYRLINVPIKSDAPASRTIHAIDVAFVAYGPFEAFANPDFQKRVFRSRSDASTHALTAEELAERGLKVKSSERYDETWTFAEADIMEKVLLRGTNHTILTVGDESAILASRPAPAFTGDQKYPNEWRPIIRQDDGTTRFGDAEEYAAYGWYMKATQLYEPKGAMFVEFHLVYSEPKGWFNGANLLRSKIPITAQNESRALRRELAKEIR